MPRWNKGSEVIERQEDVPLIVELGGDLQGDHTGGV